MGEDRKESLDPLVTIFKLLFGFWGIRLPRDVLRDCIEQKEWFKGVVLSVTFFEGIGKFLLTKYFRGKIASDRLRSTEQIIILLYASGIIEQPTYCKMMEVREFRNEVVHVDVEKVFAEPRLDPKEAEEKIRKAIYCLEELITKIPQDKDDKIVNLDDMDLTF